MPINPNIALGTQQQQPVNFLGQMGQALALKAAAQEVQGGEDLRAAYASGGNINDPEFQRRIMAANPKLGAQLIKTSAETQRINNEALTKAYANSREALSMVRSPQELLAYSVSQFNDPLIGPSLKARGLTPETVAANLQKELATSGFENVLKKSAMGLDGWFKDQTSRRNTDVSAGPGYMQANLARERFNFEKQQQEDISNVLRGNVAPTAAPSAPVGGGGGGGAVAPMTGAPVVAPTAPLASGAVSAPVAGGQVNALAPTTAPTPNVNALAGGDARQQIAAIDARINALMPLGAKAAPVIQALIGQKNSILTDEKNKYGEVRELQGIDPDTGKPTTYLGRFNNLTQRYEPIPMEEPPISVGGAGSTSSQLNVAKPPQKPTPFQSSLGTEQAKDVVANRKVAQDAASIIETNEIGRKILNSGAITGAGANFFVGLNQALKTAGIDLGYGDASANSQAYVALMAQNTGKIIKQFGAGTGLSDADREYAAKAAAGQITLDEKAIRRVLDINDRASRNVIKLHNESVKGIKSDIPLTVEIPKSGSARVFSAQEQQALEWADANPRDPRAAQIRQRLGM